MDPSTPKETATHRIAEELAARIATGEMPAGTFLPKETLLAEEFAVSRPTVRNALKQLAGMGLTQSRRGSGHKVLPWWTTASPTVLQGALKRVDLRTPGGRSLINDLLAYRLELWATTASLAAGKREESKLISAAHIIDSMRDPKTVVQLEPELWDQYSAAHPNMIQRMTVAAVNRAVSTLYQRLSPVPADPESYVHEIRKIHRAIEMSLDQDAAQQTKAHLAKLDMDLRRALMTL